MHNDVIDDLHLLDRFSEFFFVGDGEWETRVLKFRSSEKIGFLEIFVLLTVQDRPSIRRAVKV